MLSQLWDLGFGCEYQFQHSQVCSGIQHAALILTSFGVHARVQKRLEIALHMMHGETPKF